MQYREEYAHTGIRALQLARRRRLFWRMSMGMVVLLGIAAVWNSREWSPPSDMKALLVSSTPAQKALEPVNESYPSTFEGISKLGNEHLLNFKKRTFDQGGSVSSGAESPGRKLTSVFSPVTSMPLKHDVLSGVENQTIAKEIQGIEQMEHISIQAHCLDCPSKFEVSIFNETHADG
ncbi:MAG: hypothetical protein ACKO66_00045 [Flavobacteriales bacterium]